MPDPEDCRFLESHEWHHTIDNVTTLGLSRFAVEELTDITYVELPEIGTRVEAGQRVGEVESVKATSEIYAGVTGQVIETNSLVTTDPSVMNRDPYGDGWLLKIELVEPSELDALIPGRAYLERHPAAQ